MYLERFLEQTVLQLLKAGDGGISGCRAEWVGGDPSAGEAACPIVSFSLQFLRLKLVLPRGEWEQKPGGQVQVAAEREPKPSGTRCSALLTAGARSRTKSGQEMAAEGGLGVGSGTSPDPSILPNAVFSGVTQILSLDHAVPRQWRRQD